MGQNKLHHHDEFWTTCLFLWQSNFSHSPPLLWQNKLPRPKERKESGGEWQGGGNKGSRWEEESKGQERRGQDTCLASAGQTTARAQARGRYCNLCFFLNVTCKAQFWSQKSSFNTAGKLWDSFGSQSYRYFLKRKITLKLFNTQCN